MSFFTKQQPDCEFIEIGGNKIPFTLQLAKRKTIAIQVSLEGEVKVKAPLRASRAKIMQFVESKAIWILTKQAEFAAHPAKLPDDTHKFLGKNYELQVELAIANKVSLHGEKMIVETIHPRNKAKIAAQIDEWYRAQAEQIFAERLPDCLEHAKNINVKFKKEIKLRKMKSRWGSCSSGGDITLNTELVCAPEICIDYVILHELCHLREHNHSPAFYALMSKVMPDWKRTKKLLNQTVQIKKM